MSGYTTDNRIIGNAKGMAGAGTSDTNLIQIGGNAVNVNGGNRDTGTQTVTLADNDPAVASLDNIEDAVANPAGVYNGTGSGAIAAVTTVSSSNFFLFHVSVHLSSAPTTPGVLTVSIDATDGAAYDVVLESQEMAGKTDFSFIPATPLLLEDGDQIKIDYANADGRTYGYRIVIKQDFTLSE